MANVNITELTHMHCTLHIPYADCAQCQLYRPTMHITACTCRIRASVIMYAGHAHYQMCLPTQVTLHLTYRTRSQRFNMTTMTITNHTHTPNIYITNCASCISTLPITHTEYGNNQLCMPNMNTTNYTRLTLTMHITHASY